MPKRIPNDAIDTCPACAASDFRNWKACATCKALRRRKQIRDGLRRYRGRAVTTDERRELALVDRCADLIRRFKQAEFLPIILISLLDEAPRFFFISVRAKHGLKRRRRKSNLIEIPRAVVDRLQPGLHVFGGNFDPPLLVVPLGTQVSPPLPPPAALKTFAVLLPVGDWHVIPLAQRCEANHEALHLAWDYGRWPPDTQEVARFTALCTSTFCEEGSHREIRMTLRRRVDWNEHFQFELPLETIDPEFRVQLGLEEPIRRLPDRVIPSQNRLVFRIGESAPFAYTTYIPVPDGSVAVYSPTPYSRASIAGLCGLASDPQFGPCTTNTDTLFTLPTYPPQNPNVDNKGVLK